MSECPTCGRDDFKNEYGMKIHHKSEHHESLAGEEVNCDYCGDTVRVKKTRAENDSNTFCDKECSSAWKSKKFSGKNHPQYKDTDRNVECSQCGSQFQVKPHKKKKNENHFCDKECHGKWLSENKTGEEHPSYTERVKVECEYCGDTKKVTPFERDSAEKNFCSRECMYTWQTEYGTGKNAHAWSGGTARQDYGQNWDVQRKLALKRDFYRCRCCRMSHEESKEKYGEGLHVHHKTPIKHFDDTSKANRLRNLISLCKSCHHALEWRHSGRTTVDEGMDDITPTVTSD